MNKKLLKIQAICSVIILILLTVFSNIHTFIYTKILPESLKINVNKANLSELKKVPYIGEKTGLMIIHLREEKGKITDLTQLKRVKYYNRFKYFLKVE